MPAKRTSKKKQPSRFPAQHQNRKPGSQQAMTPAPQSDPPRAVGKLQGKVAIITGGDSGIGRAVAVAFAAQGADVAILYLNEHKDAREARALVEREGGRCLIMAGDIGSEAHCRRAVARVRREFGRIDILVNNAAEEHSRDSISKISAKQLERTFRTNIFSFFYMTKAALKYLHEGSTIINTTSVTAYRGSPHLIDYAATKGAIVAFTRSLAKSLAEAGIRVNGVAPGPIWTPLIPSSIPAGRVAKFGQDVPLGRAGQPEEVAPSFVFLASESDSSYITGQILHPNGGEIVNA